MCRDGNRERFVVVEWVGGRRPIFLVGGGWHVKRAVVFTTYNFLKCYVYYQKRNNIIYILVTLK